VEDVIHANGGIVWDKILSDSLLFPIDSCEVAVDILDARVVGRPEGGGDGKKSRAMRVRWRCTPSPSEMNLGAGSYQCNQLNLLVSTPRTADKYNSTERAKGTCRRPPTRTTHSRSATQRSWDHVQQTPGCSRQIKYDCIFPQQLRNLAT